MRNKGQLFFSRFGFDHDGQPYDNDLGPTLWGSGNARVTNLG